MSLCLLVMAYRVHPIYPLIVAANRDEFFRRPTAAADFWSDRPDVLAGRDFEQGGTWMGVTRSGRFAALTNVRDPKSNRPTAKSRGLIVSDFLTREDAPAAFVEDLVEGCHQYNGFNVIVADHDNLAYFNSATAQSEDLSPGIYGLSNHRLDTPWPKVIRSKAALEHALRKDGAALETDLLAMLRDRARATDSTLPDTGIGLDKERWLSPVFITGQDYGTRCSTVLMRGASRTLFIEDSFDSKGHVTETRRFTL
ncbi:MAG: NRDE family protein [Pseudomonadota bacterium]|nr:NRDE family protein [Pseudomonadota bacterium]